MKKLLATMLISVALFFAIPATTNVTAVQAQNLNICDFIGPICNAIGVDEDGENIQVSAANFIQTRGSFLISLLFIGITILAVFIIISAGVKYMQSQGEEGKITEAKEAIKSVFIGLAILIVGVVGVFLMFIFFNLGDGFLNTDPSDDQSACFDTCTDSGFGSFYCTTECADGVFNE